MQAPPLPQSLFLEQLGACEQYVLHPQCDRPSVPVKQKQFEFGLLQFENPTLQFPPPFGHCLLPWARARPGMAVAATTPATPPAMRRIALRRPNFSSATLLVRSSNQFAMSSHLLDVYCLWRFHHATVPCSAVCATQ